MELQHISEREFLNVLVNRHVLGRMDDEVVIDREYPVNLLAQIAAHMPSIRESPEAAAKQAYELIRECDALAERGAEYQKQILTFKEECKKLGETISVHTEFKKALKLITGNSRADRAADEFKRLVVVLVKKNKQLAAQFFMSRLRVRSMRNTTDADKAALFDSVMEGEGDALASEIVEFFASKSRGMSSRDLFCFSRLYSLFHARGMLDDRKHREPKSQGPDAADLLGLKKDPKTNLTRNRSTPSDNSSPKAARKVGKNDKKAPKRDKSA